MSDQAARAEFIRVRGVVQGVGFRPFVYGLATSLGLRGWVRNTSSGVEIALEGPPEALALFRRDLEAKAPPRARIESVAVEAAPLNGYQGFAIHESQPEEGAYQLVSPDIAICDDCRRELFDPHDRRYRYPFINCTNCGPRFTIIRDIPYDRPSTTMAAFEMCPECRAEYEDPRNRRFHAQPNACPVCGPHVTLMTPQGQVLAEREEAIAAARRALAEGKILAIKGLGGFHLACDATSEAAVATLRRRKQRPHKPLAVMVFDLEAARRLAKVSAEEARLLTSPERPIVLLTTRAPSPSQGEGRGEGESLHLRPAAGLGDAPAAHGEARHDAESPLTLSLSPRGERGGEADPPSPSQGERGGEADPPSPSQGERGGVRLAAGVAPGAGTVGVMLPYTPLHYLLLEPAPGFPPALVMTSGNLSEEPIAMENDEALDRLGGIADLFLVHNRGIHARYDDSVWFVPEGGPQPVRRARGYAPFPIRLPFRAPQVLACGPELKATFCLTRDEYAFLSPHIGDLENLETLEHYERSIEHYRRLFRLEPRIVAYDLHPEYLATKMARERWGTDPAMRLVGVQHHHAHIASCLVDNGRSGPAIGVALDGTGYGTDGTIWGGEILVADLAGFRRAGHLVPFPLPGGEAAIRRPYRAALGLLHAAGIDPAAWPGLAQLPPKEVEVVRQQVARGLNAPITTSAGRLFDAVAALIGVRSVVSYEAQAAMELEALAAGEGTGQAYPFAVMLQPAPSPQRGEGASWLIDWRPMLEALLADIRAGAPPAQMSARFHAGLARAVACATAQVAAQTGLRTVALSGGCFQNRLLLAGMRRALEAAGLEVLVHRQAPANDGGVALGQAAVAAMRYT